MATLFEGVMIKAPVAQVWEAVADFGNIHTRLLPGHVKASVMEGSVMAGDAVRVLTLHDGTSLREGFISIDHDRRRLAYTVESEHLTHYNTVLEVVEADPGYSRIIWTVDFLPDLLEPYLKQNLAHILAIVAGHLSNSAPQTKVTGTEAAGTGAV